MSSGGLLDSAAAAVLVLTGEDKTPEGSVWARQNVLHEMGLFQGRLGFNKVLLVADDKVEVPSNIEGWQTVRIDSHSEKGDRQP